MKTWPPPPAARQAHDRALDGAGVVMGDFAPFGAAGACALVDAGMHQGIEDEEIALLRQRRQDGEIGDIAGAEEERALGAEKDRGLRFQRLVLATISPEQPRTAGADRRALGQRRHDGIAQPRRTRQRQIIVRREVDARRAGRGCAAGPCGRGRAELSRIGQAGLRSWRRFGSSVVLCRAQTPAATSDRPAQTPTLCSELDRALAAPTALRLRTTAARQRRATETSLGYS